MTQAEAKETARKGRLRESERAQLPRLGLAELEANIKQGLQMVSGDLAPARAAAVAATATPTPTTRKTKAQRRRASR